ncbi:sensor histidine kinase [Brevibacterium casei]|uniref:sensor histidine kinase n=1 Tax=Brevibacterium casei TaxID=33889 RepID=UPI003EC1429A
MLWLSLVALAHLSRRFTDPLSVALLTVLALTAVVVPGLIPGDGLTFAFGASTLVVAALALGLLMRMFDRSLHQRQATAAEAERRRMATDLHDLVAHEVTGIVVLAQAASRAEDPSVLRAALGRIEESGSRALEEIRSLVASPAGTAAAAPTAPTAPTAAGPEALERRLEEFGASDDASTQSGIDLPAPVPTAVWATLDRVLVEALTNVRRHAGPGAHVSMTIASSPDAVALTVESTGGLGGIGRGGGTGLHGLRTRVEDLGGDLTAGPIDGAWRLRARLPLAAAPPSGGTLSPGGTPSAHARPHTPESGDRP